MKEIKTDSVTAAYVAVICLAAIVALAILSIGVAMRVDDQKHEAERTRQIAELCLKGVENPADSRNESDLVTSLQAQEMRFEACNVLLGKVEKKNG